MTSQPVKYADLHVHTFYSDSTFSPEEVIACAKDKGLAAVAITDHDTINGIESSLEFGASMGVEVIPGIEMTVEKLDAEVHVLGYFLDWKLEWLRRLLKDIQNSRIERMGKMVARLKEHDVDVDPADVIKLAGKGSVGRLHLAQAILKTGNIRKIREAFDKYIGFLKPCYVPNVKLSPEEAIAVILKAGGVPVLAHPKLMGKDEYITDFQSCGLKGIEVYHTDHDSKAVRHYLEFAEAHNLLLTGGSDCHGMGKGRVLMGGVKVPYELVEKLREESEKIRHERSR